VLAAYVFVLYLVLHLYMATLGRTLSSHIKAMIVGYEEEPDESQGNGTRGIPQTASEG
jgi:thiosulfate reductase cytochrome b subunit